MEFLNQYIAPWALSKEAIPLHCVWRPEKKLYKIRFKIPDNYKIIDTLNFSEYLYDDLDNKVIIPITSLRSINYFGVVLCYPLIIDEIEKIDVINIEFLDFDENIIDELKFSSRLIRPKLKILNYTEKITVTDATSLKDLIKFEILHQGFGTANLSINVEHSGKNISVIDSLYIDALNKIYDEVLNVVSDNKSISDYLIYDNANDHILNEIANAILSESKKNMLISTISNGDMNDIIKILQDETKKEQIHRIILKNLRSLILSALLYIAEKNPVEGIKLLYGQTAADLTDKIEELNIKITYFDSMGNMYPPLEANIIVIDKRKKDRDVKKKFDAPINIVWKKETFNLGGF